MGTGMEGAEIESSLSWVISLRRKKMVESIFLTIGSIIVTMLLHDNIPLSKWDFSGGVFTGAICYYFICLVYGE